MNGPEVDICVVGGGAAGVAAAAAGASAGCSVVLIESRASLGGLATSAMVGTVCGLYFRSPAGAARFAVGGFAREFANSLAERSESEPTLALEGLYVLPYKIAAFNDLALEIIVNRGITLICNATLKEAATQDSKIVTLHVDAGDKTFTIFPRAVIDCSGDAIAAELSGAPIHNFDTAQTSALVFEITGLPQCEPEQLGFLLKRELSRAVRDGTLPEEALRLSIVPGSLHGGKALCKLGLTEHRGLKLQEHASEMCNRIIARLREQALELGAVSVLQIAPALGVRTGRQIQGREMLCTEDVRGARKRKSGVANGAWPIEFWGNAREPEMGFFAADDYYEIPAGALRSSCLENLFAGGRCISASAEAIASARVIGTCLASGYAAGHLAAASLQREPLEATVQYLRKSQCLA